jgi:hypothetical protein
MSAKLILSLDGIVMQTYPVDKESIKIGRKADNDIVIDNLAISAEHAIIKTILHDSFLEDLDSTNGVSVNGVPVKQYHLKNNDVIEIGKFRLKYLNDKPVSKAKEDVERTMVMRTPFGAPAAKNEKTSTAPQAQMAAMKVLAGENAGSEIELDKSFVMLGTKGVQAAVVTKRPQGYYITHVEGDKHPVLNGTELNEHPHLLKAGDVVEVGNARFELYFKV